MGLIFSNIFRLLFGRKYLRILMVGLDGVGKTTILYKLKLGDVITTVPTIGFNVETIEYKNICFVVWDVAGQDKLRGLWKHYFENTQGVIFVVDSADRERLDVVKCELESLFLEDELREAVFLIFANKQDLPDAMSWTELRDKLNLESITSRKWYIQACTGLAGHGLYEGLNWLSDEIS